VETKKFNLKQVFIALLVVVFAILGGYGISIGFDPTAPVDQEVVQEVVQTDVQTVPVELDVVVVPETVDEVVPETTTTTVDVPVATVPEEVKVSAETVPTLDEVLPKADN